MLKLRDWIDIDKLNWNSLSENPNAIELLKKNQDKINWVYLSENPNIFTYDYKKMKENMKNSGIAEELMSEQPDGSCVKDTRQINLLLSILNF